MSYNLFPPFPRYLHTKTTCLNFSDAIRKENQANINVRTESNLCWETHWAH